MQSLSHCLMAIMDGKQALIFHEKNDFSKLWRKFPEHKIVVLAGGTLPSYTESYEACEWSMNSICYNLALCIHYLI